MHDRFTDRAKRVMQFASEESSRYNHESIGTEHLLLGLVKEGSGVAANVLKNLEVDLCKIRLQVEKLVQGGLETVAPGKLPQTPRAKKVIEFAIEESRSLNHNYVGAEHILLGLMREQEGVAAIVLKSLGLKLDEVREEVLNLLGHGMEASDAASLGKDLLAGGYVDSEHELLVAQFAQERRMAACKFARRGAIGGAFVAGTPLAILLVSYVIIDCIVAPRFSRSATHLTNLKLLGGGIVVGALFDAMLCAALIIMLFLAERWFGFAVFDFRTSRADEPPPKDVDDSRHAISS